MKKGIITTFLMLLCLTANAQVDLPKSLNNKLIPSVYNRNALTVVVLDNSTGYSSDIRLASQKIPIPEKFDDNTLDIKYITSDAGRDLILNTLNSSNIGNSILSKWFSRSSGGEFNMSLIGERGLYNATASDMIQASASKIGMDKIRDAGKVLVDNSYVLVLEFRDVISMREYYDRQDAANLKAARQNNTKYTPVSRTKNGWKSDVVAYLYRIDPSYVDPLFNDMWIYSDDDEATKAQKKSLFENTRFGFTYVLSVSANADGSQDNPNPNTGLPKQLSREQLFVKLANTGLKSALYELDTNYEPFKVKTALYETKPLQAKIGTKEGLGVDQRFFVYENIMNSKGEVESKRQGVVLVKKVENNSMVAGVANVQPSRFYQTAGRKLDAGMTMQQRNDYGVGISTGYGIGGLSGFYLKAEGNLATISRMLPGIDNLISITQLKLFGSVGFDNVQYTSQSVSFLRYQLGLSKGFYFLRNFSVVPFIAYASEQATLDNAQEGYALNGDFLNVGTYLTMNILHNLQFVITLNTYAGLGDAYETYEGEVTDTYSIPYNSIFDGRSGLNLEFGLRLEF